MKKLKTFEELPKTFDGLCRTLMPRAIHDEVDLKNTQEVVDVLAVRQHLNKDQQDYLDTLSALIEEYENRHHPIAAVSGVEALKFLLEQHHLTAADLSRILGKDPSLGSKILNETRHLTASHALLLATHFKVSPGTFIGVKRGKS